MMKIKNSVKVLFDRGSTEIFSKTKKIICFDLVFFMLGKASFDIRKSYHIFHVHYSYKKPHKNTFF